MIDHMTICTQVKNDNPYTKLYSATGSEIYITYICMQVQNYNP